MTIDDALLPILRNPHRWSCTIAILACLESPEYTAPPKYGRQSWGEALLSKVEEVTSALVAGSTTLAWRRAQRLGWL
jgi:hypothetical protein